MTLPKIFSGYKIGEKRHGFIIKQITPIDSLHSIVYELEHEKSGARVVHINNDDSENLFSITFPTLPQDDTGVPHILEHVVLSGSKKYPVRDPFFEMVKMSMATFINAMTDVDHTMYPVCSNVKQDLFNLADVYFDAVFHPLLNETAFNREGCAFAPQNIEDLSTPLVVNGIVYSEMHGVFSSPEAQVFKSIQQHLLSESPYRFESGGDPKAIPELTYDKFKEFWKSHYHPTQSLLVFYGNIVTDDYLEFLEPRLIGFEKIEKINLPKTQTKWNSAKEEHVTYAEEEQKDNNQNDYLCLNWLVGDVADIDLMQDLDVVNQLLLGYEGAYVRKRLLDSHIGQDLVMSGDMSIGREKIFSLCMKGCKENNGQEFKKLCFEILNEISENTFTDEEINSAFNQLAYDTLEIESNYPLRLLEDVLQGVLYNDDALSLLDSQSVLKKSKNRWLEDKNYFNNWIKENLLNNQHCLLLSASPEIGKNDKQQVELAQKLAEKKTQMSESDIKNLAIMAQKVGQEAGTANTQEQLASLPQLKLSDLPKTPLDIAYSVELLNNATLILPEMFSNSLVYIVINFDLTGLPTNYWSLLPRFIDSIEKMGSDKYSYEQIALKLAGLTDGLECSIAFGKQVNNLGKGCYHLRVAFKCLDHQAEDAINLVQHIITNNNPYDYKRLEVISKQALASSKSTLANNGHLTARLYAQRDFSPTDAAAWKVYGLPSYQYLKNLKENFATMKIELADDISKINKFILNPSRITISATCGDNVKETVRNLFGNWLSTMTNSPIEEEKGLDELFSEARTEGLASPMNVAHCVRAFKIDEMTMPEKACLTLAIQFISQEYFLPELRFKGNAYGTGAKYEVLDNIVSFTTFRDPHIANTLDIYDNTLDYVRNAEWTEEDLIRTIIGTAKNYLAPIRPDTVSYICLARYLQGITSDYRTKCYQDIISANIENVKTTIITVLEKYLSRSSICVCSSKQKLKNANDKLGGKIDVIKNLFDN